MKILGKSAGAGFALTIFVGAAAACPWCRAEVGAGVYNQDFIPNLFVLLLPPIVVGAAGCGLYYADKIAEKFRRGAK